MDVEEKINQASKLKEQGNAFFKNGETKEAIRKYYECILYVSGLDKQKIGFDINIQSLSPNQKRRSEDLQIQCYNNLAACHAKLENWSRVIETTTKVLALSPNETKALFRRGQANFRLNNLNNALQDLEAALKLEQYDPKILSELRMVKEKLAAQERKSVDELRGFLTKPLAFT